MATAAPEAAHTACGVLGGPAGARCLGTVLVDRLLPSPSWRVRCGCLRDISRTSSAARLFIHMIRSGCAASESSSPSRIGGSTTTSTLPSSARDGSARIGTPPESGRITTGRSRHPDRDHGGPAAAQHHTVGDLEHPGDGGGHASVQSHDGELVRHGSTVARSVGGWNRTGRLSPYGVRRGRVFHELDAVVGQLGEPKFMARTAWLRNHRPNRVRVAKNEMNRSAPECLAWMNGRRCVS